MHLVGFLKYSVAFILRLKLTVPRWNSLFSGKFAFESENLLCGFFCEAKQALLLGIGSETVVLENRTCNHAGCAGLEVGLQFPRAAALETCLRWAPLAA